MMGSPANFGDKCFESLVGYTIDVCTVQSAPKEVILLIPIQKFLVPLGLAHGILTEIAGASSGDCRQ